MPTDLPSQSPARISDNPVVTVVTPCLNPGLRLERCIESVARQGYRRIEHIIIDGGSTDGTVEVLARHPELRWVSEADSGQGEAINKGFAMAGGELLTWLNADDTLFPDAVETTVRAFHSKPEIGWTYGDLEWVERTARVLRPPAHVDLTSLDAGCVIYQPGAGPGWTDRRVVQPGDGL